MSTPTKSQVKRLQEAINWSYRQLKPFRENDKNAMQQFVGSHYSNSGAAKRVPMSLLELAVSTYTQRLSGGKPKVLATTGHDVLRPQAAKLQRGTNHLLEEIDFHDTLADAVQSAFFSMGIIKKGLDLRGTVEWMGFKHDVTQPFADSILLSNWVHDMSATRWDKVAFCGDRYSLYVEDAMEMFDVDKSKLHIVGDSVGGDDDRTEGLTQGSGWNREYYRDICEVWDIWDPRENRIITLAAGDVRDCEVTGEYLNTFDYDGPENGPYDLLRFTPVRGNIMPLPPVALWRDFHDLANNLMRKLSRQAERQKIITGIRPGGESDGRTVQEANDGDMIKMADTKNVATINFPGIEPSTLALLIQIKNLASWMWGNLDALGGLSPQAETLGQDKLLTMSASQRLIRMQTVVSEFAIRVIRDLAQYLYTDPFIVLPQTKRFGDISVSIPWTPEDREADYTQYNIELEPYSLQYRSPSERLETIRQTIYQLVMPFASQLAAQGIFLDFEALFKIIGDYAHLPELKELLIYTNPHHAQEGPVGSPVTSRTNTRISRPGATSQGKDEALMGHLLGMGQQNSQLAQIARPAG